VGSRVAEPHGVSHIYNIRTTYLIVFQNTGENQIGTEINVEYPKIVTHFVL
jgi:hypothetical protein